MGLGLYAHIPFCRAKCRYCNFVSFTAGEEEMASYLKDLKREGKIYARHIRNLPRYRTLSLGSLYLGGGTPTCLTGGQLFDLLHFLREEFPLNKNAEITVEGNPGTLDPEKLKILIEAGCSRLSLGVQSFLDRDLKVLGRIHTAGDVYNTYESARRAGFKNISLDLMYGLPGQSLKQWKENLRQLVSLEPEHISLYQLNLEQGTPFYELYSRGQLTEFNNETAYEMYRETMEFLGSRGYLHYEISNFARPGRESRHNRLYWQNEEYIGLGLGASGYLEEVRYTNLAEFPSYRESLDRGMRPVGETEHITGPLLLSEAMFLGLRLLEGINKAEFFQRYHVQVGEVYGKTIARLKKKGFLRESETHLALSREGLFIANEVFAEFV